MKRLVALLTLLAAISSAQPSTVACGMEMKATSAAEIASLDCCRDHRCPMMQSGNVISAAAVTSIATPIAPCLAGIPVRWAALAAPAVATLVPPRGASPPSAPLPLRI